MFTHHVIVSMRGGTVLPSAAVSSSATATAYCVYYAGLDGAVYCLDRSNGEVIWSHILGRPVPASPVLYRDLLLIGSTDGKVYALATGEDLPADDEV